MPILGVSAAIGLYCGVEPRQQQQQPTPTASRSQKVTVSCTATDLKAAIIAANAAAGPQVIDLDDLRTGCDIYLSTVDNWWYGPNGLPPILNDITINAGTLLPVSRRIVAP